MKTLLIIPFFLMLAACGGVDYAGTPCEKYDSKTCQVLSDFADPKREEGDHKWYLETDDGREFMFRIADSNEKLIAQVGNFTRAFNDKNSKVYILLDSKAFKNKTGGSHQRITFVDLAQGKRVIGFLVIQ